MVSFLTFWNFSQNAPKFIDPSGHFDFHEILSSSNFFGQTSPRWCFRGSPCGWIWKSYRSFQNLQFWTLKRRKTNYSILLPVTQLVKSQPRVSVWKFRFLYEYSVSIIKSLNGLKKNTTHAEPVKETIRFSFFISICINVLWEEKNFGKFPFEIFCNLEARNLK